MTDIIVSFLYNAPPTLKRSTISNVGCCKISFSVNKAEINCFLFIK